MVRQYIRALTFMGAMAAADTALTMKTISNHKTAYESGAYIEANPVVKYSIDHLGVTEGLIVPKLGAMVLAIGAATAIDKYRHKKYKKRQRNGEHKEVNVIGRSFDTKGERIIYLGAAAYAGAATANLLHQEYINLGLDQYVSEVLSKASSLF